MRTLCSILLVASILCALDARGQTTRDGETVVTGSDGKKIDQLLEAYHRENRVSGVILVSKRGEVIYKRGFGLANREFSVPNQPNTKFRLASIAKPLVAVLVMRLVEQGKLSLDSKVSDFLPDYRKDVAEKVTIRHLLSPTSGIPDGFVRPGVTERTRRDVPALLF